ncbi:MAG: hypothetical protein IPF82_11570 [Blastocatellia bacterium]|nr:hypothetical protein [Blastocatellia bacterium]
MITRPRTRQSAAIRTIHSRPARGSSRRARRRAFAKSGSEVASIITAPPAAETAGSGDAGAIVCGPAPWILNRIASAPGLVFADSIAARSDPVPASFVVETVKVARGDERLGMACARRDEG